MERVTYNPDVFAVADLEAARRIILTPTDLPTDERWRRETPYLAGLIHRELALAPESLLVDYGCGVGRMSGALVRAAGCRVLGVDISPQMRALAAAQEPDPRFAAVSRGLLESLVRHGLQADAAIAVWVLQHIPQVEHDAALLRAALKPAAPLLVVNNTRRAIPGKEAPWVDDGKDVEAILVAAGFRADRRGQLDPAAVGEQAAGLTFWALYR